MRVPVPYSLPIASAGGRHLRYATYLALDCIQRREPCMPNVAGSESLTRRASGSHAPNPSHERSGSFSISPQRSPDSFAASTHPERERSTLPSNANGTLQNPSAQPPNPTHKSSPRKHRIDASPSSSSDATTPGITQTRPDFGESVKVYARSGRNEPTDPFLELQNGVPASLGHPAASFARHSAKRSKRDLDTSGTHI
ncbi:hypothetical protein C8R43DRAFT_1109117 [Mycena crocata]|nr:hypothetical protein C8R43DRAFT_1109117 [Mycena crocata]